MNWFHWETLYLRLTSKFCLCHVICDSPFIYASDDLVFRQMQVQRCRTSPITSFANLITYVAFLWNLSDVLPDPDPPHLPPGTYRVEMPTMLHLGAALFPYITMRTLSIFMSLQNQANILSWFRYPILTNRDLFGIGFLISTILAYSLEFRRKGRDLMREIYFYGIFS